MMGAFCPQTRWGSKRDRVALRLCKAPRQTQMPGTSPGMTCFAKRPFAPLRSNGGRPPELLLPVAAAGTTGTDVVAARAGMRGGIVEVLQAAAIGAAVPAGAAAAGN